MPKAMRNIMTIRARPRTREVALFMAQLDDQSRNLRADTRAMTRPELAWQPAPGMNTIGMLLAHLAVVEVGWMQVGPLRLPSPNTRATLGIDRDDVGMPLDGHGRPPRALAGRTLAFYDRLLARARAHTRKVAATLRDADLEPEFKRTRRDGIRQVLNDRWVFYHVLEHFAGHYGQILLLRHQFRARGRKRGR